MSELYKLTLHEAAARLQAREISAAEMTEACLARIEATEPDINACITVLGGEALSRARALDEKGPDPQKSLWGVPIALKDLFCMKGVKTTAASKMLENFVPTYDAQVVTSLHQAGAVIVAKTNLDEFAMGTSTATSAVGPSRNPWNTAKSPGGSSGGSAASMAAYQSPGGLATDTGGSIRQPASFCGCVALKPTYGRVSRYGVIGLASSLDQPGPIARRVIDCAHLLQAVAGPDERDNTAALRPVDDYAATRPLRLKGLRLGLPEELWSIALDPELDGPIKTALRRLEDAGAELRPVSMPSLKYAVAAYHVISSAEGSTSLARYDGVRFGYRAKNPRDLNELYTASRSESLGPEVMRRVILGTFALSAASYEAYYKQAARVRRLIRDDYNQAFSGCDFLMSPVTAVPAWDHGFQPDSRTSYDMDIMTLPVNLAGLPALTLPIGRGAAEGLPVGIHLVGRAFGEAALFSAGLAFEELFPPLL